MSSGLPKVGADPHVLGHLRRLSLLEHDLAGNRGARRQDDHHVVDVGRDVHRDRSHLTRVGGRAVGCAWLPGPLLANHQAVIAWRDVPHLESSLLVGVEPEGGETGAAGSDPEERPLVREAGAPLESMTEPAIRNRRPDTMRISTPGVSAAARARTRCAAPSSAVLGKYVVMNPILSSSVSGGAFGGTNVLPRASAAMA